MRIFLTLFFLIFSLQSNLSWSFECPRYDLRSGKAEKASSAACEKLPISILENENIAFFQFTDLRFPNGTQPKFQLSNTSLKQKTEKAIRLLKSLYPLDQFQSLLNSKIQIFFENLRTAQFYENDSNKALRAFWHFSPEERAPRVYIDLNGMNDSVLFPTLIHELHHVVQRLIVHSQPQWADEGLAVWLESYVGGNTQAYLEAFRSESEHSLMPMRKLAQSVHDLGAYGLGYIVFRYLGEHYGQRSFVRKFLASRNVGRKGIEDAVSAFTGKSVSFDQILASCLDELFLTSSSYLPEAFRPPELISRVHLSIEPQSLQLLDVPKTAKILSLYSNVPSVQFLLWVTDQNGNRKVLTAGDLEEMRTGDGNMGYKLPVNANKTVLYIQNVSDIGMELDVEF